MTAVSQLLPNFIQGINEQPDELKKPGQLRDAVNVYPDVTKGLLKRTGYALKASLLDDSSFTVSSIKEGTWFTVTRRQGELQKKYIFNVSPKGFVRGWDADDGTSQTIYKALDDIDLGEGDEAFDSMETVDMTDIEYLSHDSSNNYAIKTATLADTAFLCNTSVDTKMDPFGVEVRPYEAFIEFKVIDVTRAYKINFDRVGNGTNTVSQVVKIKEVERTNFFSAGRSENNNSPFCSAASQPHVFDDIDTAINDKYPIIKNGVIKDSGVRTGPGKAPLQIRVTINSSPDILPNSEDYQCNYDVADPEILSGGQGWKEGDRFEVTIPGGPYGDEGVEMKIKYKVTNVLSVSSSIDEHNISIVPSLSGTVLLDNLQNLLANEIISRVSDLDPSNIELVGNGIYIRDDRPFKIDTSEPDLLNILNNQAKEVDGEYPNPVAVVNNVSNLPLECKQGMVVKVQNSFSDDDDYFVQFVRDYGDIISENNPLPTTDIEEGKLYIITTTDGTFDWSCVDPNLTEFSPEGTQFVATESETLTGSNTVTEIIRRIESSMGYWKEVAKPGELTTMMSTELPHVLKYRYNTNDWVVGSVDYASRSCGTEDQFTPSFISKKINNILFYRNRLVFLSDSSVVTSSAGDFTNFFPSTALTVSPSDPVDVEANSNYTANLYAGLQINNALLIFGEYNQFLLTTDSDIFSPSTAKLSQVSSYKFDTNSEPFVIGTNVGFVGNSDTLSSMYEITNIFREGQTDVVEKSKLISTSFEADYSMISSSTETGLITFGKKGTDIIWLYKYFKESSQSDLQQAWFKWKLPSNVVFQFIDGHKHYAVTEAGNLLFNDLDSDLYQDNNEDYEMKITLPTFYLLKSEQKVFRADTTASLVIHRMHLNTGMSNCYTIDITRAGKDPYNVDYEQSIQDAYGADNSPVTSDREQTVPLYEKNSNLDISITSKVNGPFTLYSLRWEGDYNNRYYQRV